MCFSSRRPHSSFVSALLLCLLPASLVQVPGRAAPLSVFLWGVLWDQFLALQSFPQLAQQSRLPLLAANVGGLWSNPKPVHGRCVCSCVRAPVAPAAAAAMASRGTHPHSASCPLAGYIKQLHALHKGFEFDGGIDLEPIRMDAFSGAYMEYCRVMHGNESPREWGWLASPLPHACFGATVRCSPGGGGRWVSDAPSCFHLTKHLPHRHA